MPFTLSHPAAVLPVLRRPFVPSALVAGAMAPDIPYLLNTLGVTATGPQDWYEPLLNATNTHSPGWGLSVSLLFTLCLVAAYRLLRGPVTALLPTGFALPEPGPTAGVRARTRYTLWLLLSALIGITSHVAWDSLTHGDGFLVTHVALLREPVMGGLPLARLFQYVSAVGGLAVTGTYLWRHRSRLRTEADTTARLRPAMRWSVIAALVAATVLGGAAQVPGDIGAHRYETEYDYSRPIVRDLGDSTTETSYPGRTVATPWGTLAEEVLTPAAKRAGASSGIALLLYGATWHALRHRGRPGPEARLNSGQPSGAAEHRSR
ncbi:DUF4184 family protein [Streptomyces sp. UNOC14_S4]|uniref:DUF4184 family protein n=1 Tax=Streptomyces sp. UNOC14_S4 TaxID=2872340 RepID=UPI001E4D0089|nr:DUF4184 family protein [Streptomyces sp. UNOC14_S4]MCC3768584.1 DUF4184 family protein [Streptomyces sp. UNOC14_S4]